jgi:hypothetical protein
LRRVIWVAAVSTSVAGLLGGTWFALYLRQPMLGFEDTDDPELGVRFVREHPHVFPQTGIVLILMALVLVVAVASVAELHVQVSPRWPIHATSAVGMFASLCFLVFGVMRIGASGPLLHIAGLRQEWGEVAYLVVQMAGVQGVLPAGMLALAVWAVGLSTIGLRKGTIPTVVCLLGAVPAVHVLGRIIGEAGGLPEGTWIVLMLSIPGTLVWCLALGIGLMTRLRRSALKDAQPTSEAQP